MTDPRQTDAADLEHQLMLAHDRILGLRAENAQLRDKVAFYRDEPITAAYERIEELEEQREGLIHVIGDLREQISRIADEMRASTTWRMGRLVMSPLTVARRLRRSA